MDTSVTTTAHPVSRSLGLRLTLAQRRYLLAAGLLAPAILLRLFTTIYPFLQTGLLSVQRYRLDSPPPTFVGLGNFERLANDFVVRESISFTIIFVFVSTFFQIVFGLAVAHLLNARFHLRGLARTISLIPWAIPMVVAATAFRWMFDDDFGMIPDFLWRVTGLETTWLINPQNARLAIVMVSIWKSTPFVALLLLAGMQGIPHDLYEAARVDGATWRQLLRFITIPMLLPIIISVSMFMLIWQLAVFDLPYAMTGGGPGFSTTVLAQKIYLTINSLDFGYAAALGIVLIIIVAIIGGIGMYLFRRAEVSH